MNSPLMRAELLLNHGRPEEAQRELVHVLAENPQDPIAHSLMALCLLETKSYEQATEYAQQGVGLGPDLAFPHMVLSRVWLMRNYLDRALTSVDDAIQIEPENATLHVIKASILLNQSKSKEAVAAADRALALNAENVDALNLRAEALRRMGQPGTAEGQVRHSLAIDPHDDYTHATAGWNALQKGDRKKAEEHFREALRLNPENEWARQGVLHALKAKNPLYRLFLNYLIWMANRTQQMQWVIILGAYFVYRIAFTQARQHPEWGYVLWPVVILYLAWVAMSWFAEPISNLALYLHPFGRLALSPPERRAALWTGITLGVGLPLVGVSFLIEDDFYHNVVFGIGFASAAYSVCLAMSLRPQREESYRKMKIYALVVGALLGLFCLLTLVQVAIRGFALDAKQLFDALTPVAGSMYLLGILGSFLSVIVANVLAGVAWKK